MARLFPFRPESPEVTQEPRLVNLDDTGADDVFAALSSDTARTILARLYEEPGTATDVADAADTSLQNARYHLDKLSDAGLVEEVDTWYSSRGTEMTVYAPTNEPLVVAAGREESTGLLRDALKRVLGAVGILGVASLLVDRVARTPLLGGSGGAEPFSGSNDEGVGGAAGNGDGGGDASDAGGDPGATETPTEDTATVDLYLEAERTPDPGTPISEGAAETPTPTEVAEEGTRNADVSPHATNTTEAGGATSADPTATAAAEPGAMADGGLVDAVASLPPGALFFAGGLLVIALAVGWWYTFSYRPAFA